MDSTRAPESTSAEARRGRILGLLREQEFVRVTELAQALGVSGVTIRADLGLLEEQGTVRRVHGGAILARSDPAAEPSFELALGSAAVEKAQIARHAAGLVGTGESILIDAGTTSTYLARELAARSDVHDVVVFTNGLRTALELEPAIPRLSVLVTGGTLRPLKHSLVDPLAAPMLQEIHAETAFLSCHGIDPGAGVTSMHLLEATMKRRMIHAARRRVLVADSSKVGRIGLVAVCAAADVDLLVTGRAADPDVLAAVAQLGVTVELAG